MATSDTLHLVTAEDPPRVLRADSGRWSRAYRRVLILGDATSALVAAILAYVVRFGEGGPKSPYLWLSVALPVIWVLAMGAARAYERRFFAVGSEEFRRVLTAAVLVIAVVGTTAWAVKYDLARGYVVLALPLATILSLGLRVVARARLHALRRQGRCVQRLIVVGHEMAALALIRQTQRDRAQGMQVVGACLPTAGQRESLLDRGVPVAGTLDTVARAVELTSAHAVAVMPMAEMDGPALRALSWQLERTGTELFVAPALMDVAGPRIVIRPVDGLPLLHVDHAELTGVRRLAKGLFDWVLAACAVLILLPVLLVIAFAVRATSSGPAIFRQRRVGKHGDEFTMLKFRTMKVDAERHLGEFMHLNVHGGQGVLFKIERDPRVTRVGGWLRKYSLDELPQLLNVLEGSMSLVGPRPPLPDEVAQYDASVRRRLLVKPGMTGLWQVSGRSDLTWEESVRLDLRYVENWSLPLDFVILLRTIRTVVRGEGAY